MDMAVWNIRGFGNEKKKSMIKGLIKEERLDLIGLVETKHSTINDWDMKQCWGLSRSDYMHVSTIQGSGGLLISWHQEAFKMYNAFAKERWICVEGEVIKSGLKCAIRLVYGPNDQQDRILVWN